MVAGTAAPARPESAAFGHPIAQLIAAFGVPSPRYRPCRCAAVAGSGGQDTQGERPEVAGDLIEVGDPGPMDVLDAELVDSAEQGDHLLV